jgi:phosphoribosylformylglycinamidine cyclo-ligase
LSEKDKKGMTYKEAGVDIDAGTEVVRRIKALVESTYTPRVLESHGAFGGLFSLDFDARTHRLFKRNYREPVLVAGADGVGTKLKIAFVTGVHNTVGIDLVAMSANDILVQGAEPLFFLDYVATGKVKPVVVAEIVEGIASGCKDAGCALLGGETAELPGFYKPGEYDLAGFALGVVEKRRIVDGSLVEPGDVIIGIDSSGLHSNGYSLVRAVFEKASWDYSRHVPEFGCTLGEELLRPTQLYCKQVLSVIRSYQKRIVLAIAHITGGGLVENIPRVLPGGCSVVIDRNTWERPPVFGIIQNLGNVEEAEMYRVFNMGIGMVLVVPEYNANVVVRKLKKQKLNSRVIGKVVRGDGSVRFSK